MRLELPTSFCTVHVYRPKSTTVAFATRRENTALSVSIVSDTENLPPIITVESPRVQITEEFPPPSELQRTSTSLRFAYWVLGPINLGARAMLNFAEGEDAAGKIADDAEQ